MRGRAMLIVCLLPLVLMPACGGDDSDDSGPGGASGAETSQGTGERPKPNRTVVAATLNRIVAECERRRGATGQVGDVSRRFDVDVQRLILQYNAAPRTPFKPTPGAPRTTMTNVLQRVQTTLRSSVPSGCGTNVGDPQSSRTLKRLNAALSRP